MMIRSLALLFLIVNNIAWSRSQLVSPCPKLFRYETNTSETDRWYGVVTLLSDSELSGIWLRLIFDKPSLQLGNWFGEVKTTDNTEYLVKNRNFKLPANQPHNLRFYITYDPQSPPPKLVMFRLNAKTVCPEAGATTPTPEVMGQLLTSNVVVPTPSRPISNTQRPSGSGSFNRPTGGQNSEEDDAFPGDISILNRPISPGGGGGITLGDSCGTVVIPPKPLITYGQATHEGEFPWHAALYHAKGIDLTYICGGSLISRSHVLTVAHCVTRRTSQKPLDPESLIVYLGKYYLRRWSNPGIQDRVVDSIIPHPNYNSQTYTNDIAVLKLATPVQITNYVRPVCLWEEDVNLQSVINRGGTVVGWGFDETGRVTEELTKAEMPVVSQETCIYSFPDFFSRFTSTTTFCGGFRNDEISGTSVCNGDSGGGMVFPKQGKTSSSAQSRAVWQIRGLVSISVALQNQFKCDSSHYVVFTDVAKYLDWIKASLV